MKMHKVDNKIALQVFEKFHNQFSSDLLQKLKFFETILKVHSTKRENAFENLNHISFLTRVASKNLKHLSL